MIDLEEIYEKIRKNFKFFKQNKIISILIIILIWIISCNPLNFITKKDNPQDNEFICQSPTFDFSFEERMEKVNLEEKIINQKVTESIRVRSVESKIRLDKATIDLPYRFFDKKVDTDGEAYSVPIKWSSDYEFKQPDNELKVEFIVAVLKNYLDKKSRLETGDVAVEFGLEIPVAINFRYTCSGKPNHITGIFTIESDMIRNFNNGGLWISRIYLERYLETKEKHQEVLSELFYERGF